MIEAKFSYDIAVLKKRMAALSNKVIPYMKSTSKQVAEFALQKIKYFTRAPTYTKGATKLADLWEMTYSRKGTVENYIIKNTYPIQDVILFFEEGTNPHVIRPVKASILRWVDEDSGDIIFARSVMHPGTIQHAMLAQTEKLVQPEFDKYIQKCFQMTDRMLGK